MVTISVLKSDDMPSADPQTATLPAAANTLDLTIATVDSDTQFVSLFINSLPVQGSLYYSSSTSTSQVASFVNLSPPPIEQFGHKILESSTFYPSGAEKKWHPDMALGPPDAIRTYGDSTLASCFRCAKGCTEPNNRCGQSITTGGKPCPLFTRVCAPLTLLFRSGFDNTTHNNFDPVNGDTLELVENECWDGNARHEEKGYSEFLTIQFEKQVYIKDIEIGEPRGPMSTVAIEAYDYTTKSWMVMWSGEADFEQYMFLKNTQQFSVFLPYPLCQPSFKTDIVRIKQDTKTIDDWNEIDYVKLVGSEEATPGALPGTSLVYEPPSGGLDCEESFTFSMSDCGGQRTRLSEVQTYTILPAGGGTDACEPLVEELDEGVPLGVVFGIVGGAVVLVLVIAACSKNKEKKLVSEKMLARRNENMAQKETKRARDEGELIHMENVKLKNDVAIMQEYNQDEISMLEGQIKRFTADMAAAEAITDGVLKDMQKMLIKADELVGKVVIGAGAYGEVFRSDYRGTAVAVKCMKQVDEKGLERFQAEIMLMGGLRHQNIVAMVGCCWEKDLMALVMEYCEKGTSTDVLRAEAGNLTWDDPLMKWLLDVSRGMGYLHGMAYYDKDKKEQIRGIIHRDLKPDNCLVTETWGVRIADFGEARAALEDATMTQVGTPIYISPEIVRGEYYTEKTDVFSFAMTILQFCLKEMPLLNFMKEEYKKYTGKEPTLGRLTLEVAIKGWRPNLEGIEGIPLSLVDLLNSCWGEFPDQRPAFGEVVEFVQAEVRHEVMGGEDGGATGRRTSTSGGLAMRIRLAKAVKEAKEVEERASRLLDVDSWSKDELKEAFLKQKKELEEMYYAENKKMKSEC